MAVLDGMNYYLQSSQFQTLMSEMHVKPVVYLWLAGLGFITFLAHGRDNA